MNLPSDVDVNVPEKEDGRLTDMPPMTVCALRDRATAKGFCSRNESEMVPDLVRVSRVVVVEVLGRELAFV